jgi:aspartate aminotransferase
MQLSQRAIEMPASPIRRLARIAEQTKSKGIKVFHLNIGQPDIETPPEMLQAVARFEDKVLAYGPSEGLKSAREKVASYLNSMGQPCEPDDIFITTGGSEAILFAMMAVCDVSDEIIIFEPFYTNYAGFAKMTGAVLSPLETKAEDGFRPPAPEVIAAKITKKTKAILYCSPCNPTGTVLTREEIEGVIRIAIEKDLFVIADEVYREFVYEGAKHCGVLEVAKDMGALERVILVDSISKRFSACGARIGYLVTHNTDVQSACLRFAQARLCPPTLGQIAMVAGYDVWSRYVPQMISEYEIRRNCVVEAISRIKGAVCVKPEGAFYVMPQLPISDCNDFATFLLEEFSENKETVMVAPGDGFYYTEGKGKQEVRIAYVLNKKDLERAMDLLVKGLEAFSARWV